MSKQFTKEQERAIFEREYKEILVSAGAGAGKTSVLIERIVNLISDPNNDVDIDNLLIVTFTNEASSVMKDRLGIALQQKLLEQPDNDKIMRQIYMLGRANISTIHSFCQKVIEKNYNKIDIDPDFRTATEEETDIIKNEIVNEVLEKFYSKYELEENNNFYKLVRCFVNKVDDNNFIEMFMKTYDKSYNFPYPKQWLKNGLDNFDLETYDEFLQKDFVLEYKEYLNKFIKKIQNFDNKWVEEVSNNEKLSKITTNYIDNSYYDKFTNMSTLEFFENINIVLDFDRYKCTVRGLDDSDKEVYEQYKAERDKLKKNAVNIQSDIHTYILDKNNIISNFQEMYRLYSLFIDFYDTFDIAYKNRKKALKIIDFSDMEQFALQILINCEEGVLSYTDIAKYYENKFYEVIVDEYQDCNDTQETIFKSISNDGKKMFMVGDVKQSIYKFRGAKPNIFIEKYTEQSEDRLVINLNKNFRSTNKILDFVNIIFSKSMLENYGGINYTKGHQIESGREWENPDNVQVMCVNTCDVDEYSKVAEAEMVAGEILKLVKEGKNYKDIAILLRSKSNINYFKDVFDKYQIPYLAKTEKNIYHNYELQIILSYLKIIDNRFQDIPLVAVLKMPIYNFNEEELLYIKRAFPRKNYFSSIVAFVREYGNLNSQEEIREFFHNDKYSIISNEELVIFGSYDDEEVQVKIDYEYTILLEKAKLFLGHLFYFRSIYKKMSISSFVSHIIEVCNINFYIGLYEEADIKLANINFLIEKSKEFERTNFTSIFNFIKFLESQEKLDEDSGSTSVSLENSNQDIVKIMTTHASKGLEFDTVFVSQLEKQFNKMDTKASYVLDENMNFKYKDENGKVYKNICYLNTVNKINMSILAEEIRILYVALTRAEKKMYITTSIKKEDELQKLKNSYQNIVEGNLDDINSPRDIVIPIVLNYPNKCFDLTEVKYEEVIEKNKKLVQNIDIKQKQQEEVNIDEKNYYFEYNYNYLRDIPKSLAITKAISVLEQNKENQKIDKSDEVKKAVKVYYRKPKFFKDVSRISNAEIGNAYHKVFQLIPFNKVYTEGEIKEFLQKLVEKNILKEVEILAIKSSLIANFFYNDVYQDILTSEKVYKEKQFVLGDSASNFYGDDVSNEDIYLNGIIDMFYIKDNKIYIIDYKTDTLRKNNIEEVVQKYKKQLEYYKIALEKTFKLPVEKISIYFIYDSKFIDV